MPSESKIGPNSAMDWLARSTTCLPMGARSSVYVSSSVGAAWPRSTMASFQARL
jgi:hypothetical protein